MHVVGVIIVTRKSYNTALETKMASYSFLSGIILVCAIFIVTAGTLCESLFKNSFRTAKHVNEHSIQLSQQAILRQNGPTDIL